MTVDALSRWRERADRLRAVCSRCADRVPRSVRRTAWAARGLVALALMMLLVLRVDMQRLQSVDAFDVTLAALLLGASYAVAAWKWMVHLPADIPLGWWRSYRLYQIGLFWNNFLPSAVGGDVVRGWQAGANQSQRVSAYASVMADRLTSAVVMFAIGTIAIVVGAVRLPGHAELLVVAGLPGFVLLTVLLVRRTPYLRALRSPRRVAAALGIGLCIQVMQVLVNLLVLRAVGADPSVALLVSIIPVAAALSTLPVSINGIGMREGTVAALLVSGGVPAGQAVTGVFVVWSLLVLMSLPGGVLHLTGRRASSAAEGTLPELPDAAQTVEPHTLPARVIDTGDSRAA